MHLKTTFDFEDNRLGLFTYTWNKSENECEDGYFDSLFSAV